MNKGTLGPLIRNAKDEGWAEWIQCEADELAVMHGCTFSIERAEHVRTFFKRYLKHSKGEWGGKPFELMDWQWWKLIGPTFGWVNKYGHRRIQKVYCEIPKKNGKSAVGSAVGIYMLVGDGEAGAEVFSAATKRDQAKIVHDEAIHMVEASDVLLTRLRLNRSTGVITHEKSKSFYKALSSDAGGSEGLNAHAIIYDELHAWKDRTFWDSLRFSGAARQQPLKFIITTAGIFDKTTVGWEQHALAERWIEGPKHLEDDTFWAFIAAADVKDDWEDPKVHEKANPSWGVVIKPEEMAKAAKDASDNPTELNSFLRYRLNIWTESVSAFLDIRKWDACGRDFNESELYGRRCFGGLDLASKQDLAAFVLLFPPDFDDTKWRMVTRCWVPKENASQREKIDHVPYLTWGGQGAIELTHGDRIDYDYIREQILRDDRMFNIVDIGADPYNLEYLRQRLGDDVEIIEYQQGIKTLSEPTKEFEAMIAKGDIVHDNNPVARWCAKNVVVKHDENDNIKPIKNKSTEKIDIMIAAFMALGRALVSEDAGDSVYNTEELIGV